MNQEAPRVLLLGAGRIAWEYLRVLEYLNVGNVAVLGRTAQKAQRIANEFPKAAILLDGIIDAIHGFNPTHIISAVSLESQISTYELLLPLSDKIELLMEKPLAFNKTQGQFLVKLAAEPRNCFVAMNRRFYSSTHTATLLIENQGLSPRFISVTDQENWSEFTSLHPSMKSRSDLIFSNSIHLIDLLRVFARGELISVHVGDAVNPQLFRVEGQFSSGDAFEYTLFWDRPAPWAIEFSTEQVYIQLSPLELGRYRTKDHNLWCEIPLTDEDINFKPGFYRQTQAFVQPGLGDRAMICALDDAIESLRLADKIASLCAPA